MKKVHLVVFLVILCLSFNAYSYDGFIEAESDTPQGVSVERYSPEKIMIKAGIEGMFYRTHVKEGRVYAELSFEDGSVYGEYGDPKFPVYYKLVQIPESAEYTVTYTLGKAAEIDLLAETGAERLYPVQLPVPKDPEAEIPGFIINKEKYRAKSYMPEEFIKVNDEIRARGKRLLPLTIFPLKYNPSTERLMVYTDINITIELKNSDMEKTARIIKRYESSFSRIYDSASIGSSELKESAGAKGFDDEGILIITADALYSGLSSFVEWKEKKGYIVTVTQQSDITNGSTTGGIQSYIQDAYDNWAVPPASVILVGDSDTIPTYTGASSGTAADVYFVYLDGSDYFPDAGISRISVRTAGDLSIYLGKLLYYEQYQNSNLSWMTDVALAAGYDSSYSHVGEGTFNYVASTHLDPNGWDYDKLYAYSDGATASQVIASMNAGKIVANYSAHCSQTVWAFGSSTNITVSNVNALTNQNMYFFAVGNCCLSAQFNTYDECIGEAFIRADNAGFAYWGASNSSYWDEDDYLARRSWDAFFDGMHTLDQNTNYSKVLLWNYYSGRGQSRYYMDMYVVFGDGTTFVPSASPVTPSVVSPDLLPVGTGSFQVTVSDSKGAVENAIVSAYNPALGIRGASRTNASGTATVTLDSPLSSSGDFLLVVTHPNIVNYEKTILIGSASDGIVSFDADIYSCTSTAVITLSDSDLSGEGTHNVNVSSTTNPSGVTLTLYETSTDGVFEGSILLGTGIAVAHNDTLTVTYYDEDTGSKKTRAEYKTDTAVVDCQGPSITDVAAGSISGDSAHITFNTGENAISSISYGLSCSSLTNTVDVSTSYVTAHGKVITGLAPNTRYYYKVTAQDSAGNQTETACYNFSTLNTLVVGNGTTEITNAPLYTYYEDNRTQVIYQASDLGNAPMTINSLSINVSSLPSLAMTNWTIRMKHTTKADYESSAVFETTGWTVVYQNTTTISETGWNEFVFSAPFEYDGTQNLMVDFSFNNSSWASPGGKVFWTPTSTKRSIYGYTDSGYGDPLNWTTGNTPTVYTTNNFINLKLGLAGDNPPLDLDKAMISLNADFPAIYSWEYSESKPIVFEEKGSTWSLMMNGNYADKIVAGDITGDGRSEYVAYFAGSGLYFYDFTGFNLITTAAVNDFELADISGTGQKTLIASLDGFGLYKWEYSKDKSTWQFSPDKGTWVALTTQTADLIQAVDIYKNGVDELFLVFQGINAGYIYQFAESQFSMAVSLAPSKLSKADIDGDGYAELITAFNGAGIYIMNYSAKVKSADKGSVPCFDILNDITESFAWISKSENRAFQWMRILVVAPDADAELYSGNINGDAIEEIFTCIAGRTYYYQPSNQTWNLLIAASFDRMIFGNFSQEDVDDIILSSKASGFIYLYKTAEASWERLLAGIYASDMAVVLFEDQ